MHYSLLIRALAGALLMTLALPLHFGQAGAQVNIKYEGEWYVDYHNTGGYMVQINSCHGASNGDAVDGIDRPGEWIDLIVDLPVSPCWSAGIKVQGHQGQMSMLRLTLLYPAEGGLPVVRVNFIYTGVGIGCTFPYPETLGDAPFCVLPGIYRARIELVTGDWTRIDVLMLYHEESPVSAGTWGGIKALY